MFLLLIVSKRKQRFSWTASVCQPQPDLSCLTSAQPAASLQREQSREAVSWMTMINSGGWPSCFRNITLAGDIQIIPAPASRNEHGDIQNMKNSSADQPKRFLPARLQLAPLSRLQVALPPSISLQDPFILSSHCTPATITPSPCYASHITAALAKWRFLSVPSNEWWKRRGCRANHIDSGTQGLNSGWKTEGCKIKDNDDIICEEIHHLGLFISHLKLLTLSSVD